MLKYYCDRCKKEIGIYELIKVTFANKAHTIGTGDLCEKCYERIMNFISKNTEAN